MHYVNKQDLVFNKTLLSDLNEYLIMCHAECGTSIVIPRRDYVGKLTYNRYDPY